MAKENLRYPVWQDNDKQLQQQRFMAGLSANHAEVICISSLAIADTIEKVLINQQCKHVILGSACDHTACDNVSYACRKGEFYPQILEGTRDINVLVFDTDVDEIKSTLFNDIDAGITHSLAGIADTGTLVLWPDRAEPRTLSLIPPCHIALIKRSAIVSNFAELMAEKAWQQQMPTNIVLISGPSKTADIQQTLAYGAHGPRQLVVILIEDM
ncbi:lactate utilization protein C [Shewanella sp. VB17]|nr:lactate utilization protein C [Shewanella sp. VB17]